MAGMNGVEGPQPDPIPSLSATHKRKRTESVEDQAIRTGQGMGQVKDHSLRQTLQNVLQVLRKYDSSPSLLQFALPSSPSDEHSMKRVRLSSENEQTESIESRIEAGSYSSLDSLISDFNQASASIVETLQPAGDLTNGSQPVSPPSNSQARDQIAVATQMFHKLLRLETRHRPEMKVEDIQGDAAKGILDSDSTEKRAVLSLTSHTEKGPKQLWSGIQESKDFVSRLERNDLPFVGTYPKLKAKSLPNGIKIADAALINEHDTMKEPTETRTLGEVFQPHRSLKSLEPPRPSKNPTRGSSLTFVNQYDMAASEKATPIHKGDYRYASLPAGQWLHYNNAGTVTHLAPEARRRQRDHALSFGEGKAEVPVEELFEHEQAKTKALFHAAFSSFAPAFDNSAAIIPEQVRTQLWWSRTGQNRFNALLSIQYPEADVDSDPRSEAATEVAVDADFAALVASYEPEPNPLIESETSQADAKDVEEVLQEITDLIETMSSYQRIRNLSSTPRPAVAEVSRTANSSAVPSMAESDIYNTLKSSLALLIDSLPPYAVAKLDGHQLEDLNISTKMIVNNTDYAGTMEKDDFALQRQKASANATMSAAGRAGTTLGAPGRPGNYTTPATSSAAVAYNQRAYTANAPRVPFQQPARPSMPSYSSSNTANQAFHTPRPPSSTSQRQPYPQQQMQQATPTHAYSHPPTTQQFQRPTQNGYGAYGNQAGTPSQSNYAQRASQSGYQQRAQDNIARSASPQKPVMNGQPSYFQRSQQPQSTPHPSARTPPVPYTNTGDQQALIDRAKAQQPQELQRQMSGASQTPGSQYSNVAGSLTPGGQNLNGRAVAAAVIGE